MGGRAYVCMMVRCDRYRPIIKLDMGVGLCHNRVMVNDNPKGLTNGYGYNDCGAVPLWTG